MSPDIFRAASFKLTLAMYLVKYGEACVHRILNMAMTIKSSIKLKPLADFTFMIRSNSLKFIKDLIIANSREIKAIAVTDK